MAAAVLSVINRVEQKPAEMADWRSIVLKATAADAGTPMQQWRASKVAGGGVDGGNNGDTDEEAIDDGGAQTKGTSKCLRRAWRCKYRVADAFKNTETMWTHSNSIGQEGPARTMEMDSSPLRMLRFKLESAWFHTVHTDSPFLFSNEACAAIFFQILPFQISIVAVLAVTGIMLLHVLFVATRSIVGSSRPAFPVVADLTQTRIHLAQMIWFF
jgi:hypothetical protein